MNLFLLDFINLLQMQNLFKVFRICYTKFCYTANRHVTIIRNNIENDIALGAFLKA